MRCGSQFAATTALLSLLLSVSPSTDSLSTVHRQRYAMGTMFDIVVHHASRSEAERAVEAAMAEILRLDAVLSHYKPDSDLSRLNRDGRTGPIAVDSSLYEVIQTSIALSGRSGGTFDVTVAPLVKMWHAASANGRQPLEHEIAAARRCVGSEKIEITAPNRIRLRSDCLEIDLGGIGKGYAVERAMATLSAAGIRHALVNAGGSSIAATGDGRDRTGWPVAIGRSVLVLREGSLSTSQQDSSRTADPIVDPRSGAPAANAVPVSVVARSATLSDALSTTLVMLSVEEGKQLLARFPDVSAVWLSPAGDVHATYRGSSLALVATP